MPLLMRHRPERWHVAAPDSRAGGKRELALCLEEGAKMDFGEHLCRYSHHSDSFF